MLTHEFSAVGYRLGVLSLLEQVQELVETSPKVPLSDRVVVSQEALIDLLDAVRNALPHDVIEADRLLQSEHRLLSDAQEKHDQLLRSARDEADQLVESARAQSAFMLQEHHVAKAAEIRGERIIDQARREAEAVIASADEYVEKLFSHFEHEALRLAGEIRTAAARRA